MSGEIYVGEEKLSDLLIKMPVQYAWAPKEDITAYELALALPCLFHQGWHLERIFEELPQCVRRHFACKTQAKV